MEQMCIAGKVPEDELGSLNLMSSSSSKLSNNSLSAFCCSFLSHHAALLLFSVFVSLCSFLSEGTVSVNGSSSSSFVEIKFGSSSFLHCSTSNCTFAPTSWSCKENNLVSVLCQGMLKPRLWGMSAVNKWKQGKCFWCQSFSKWLYC